VNSQRNDPTFIPIEEFNRDPVMHIKKLKPGECFWESHECVDVVQGNVVRQEARLAGVVIGPDWVPKP
jgi:hypothetical protein